MLRLFLYFLLFAVVAAGGFFVTTRPVPLSPADVPALEGNPAAGRNVFLAAGCVSCHADRGSEPVQEPILAGGQRLKTPYGTFTVPNISQDPEHGIGAYELADLASVLTLGVTPDGRHLYPAMPYTSYARMEMQDIADLLAYLKTLPASSDATGRHDLSFPYAIRLFIGGWKQLYMDQSFVGAAPSARLERGRYLVEALAHCGECHTPRDRFGGLDRTRWMAGAPDLNGKGAVPNITPAALDWSLQEITWYLESGFNPDHREVGRDMEAVIASLGQLPRDDLEAIAAYVGGLAPIP